jgi:putative acetyltransferase
MLKDMIMLKKELNNPESQFCIEKATTEDYPGLMKVWESAVKATHHFLKPEDFAYYKKMGPTKYLPAIDLHVLRIESTIIGFIGVSGNHLELLFIDADSRGKGYGKFLLNYAIRSLSIITLDVNEQNTQALGFYEKAGFSIAGRSEKDAEGKDYPILHLRLQ